jgi:hypothetical protein
MSTTKSSWTFQQNTDEFADLEDALSTSTMLSSSFSKAKESNANSISKNRTTEITGKKKVSIGDADDRTRTNPVAKPSPKTQPISSKFIEEEVQGGEQVVNLVNPQKTIFKGTILIHSSLQNRTQKHDK